jgi:hypothetical protein
MSCKFGSGSEYSSSTDKFSIAFPSGGSEVETKTDDVKYAKAARSYSKSFDNRSDNFRSYEVQVLDIDSSAIEGKTPRQILEIALNGWEKEPETKIKEITVNGKNGIDSLRTITMGKISMAFREVVFWSEADKKLYVVKVSAVKKENTQTVEAEKFVNSFKLNA